MSLKDLFGKKDTDNVPEAVYEEEKGDYSVKQNKTLNTVMKIVAVLAAFALWAYVYSTTITTDEATFSLIKIDERNADILASEHDLVVQSLNVDTLNITIMGNINDVSSVTSTDVKAYINLRNIEEPGEYTLDVIVDVPQGVTVVNQTVSQVVVSVDTSTEKTFDINGSSVILSGWTLETGFQFGNIATNASKVQVRGASKNIEQISRVGLKTATLGNINNSLSADCDIVLFDSAGNELDMPSVQVYPDVENIEASIEVFKEKTIPLTLSTEHKLINSKYISIDPEYVTVKGEPSAVDNIESISLGVIDEKRDIDSLVYETAIPISVKGLEILDRSGNKLENASVSIDLTSLPSKRVSGIPLYKGRELIGSASVNVVAVSDSAYCRVMTDRISGGDLKAYTDDSMTDVAIDIDSVYSVYLYDYGEATIDVIYDPADDEPTDEPTEGSADGSVDEPDDEQQNV